MQRVVHLFFQSDHESSHLLNSLGGDQTALSPCLIQENLAAKQAGREGGRVEEEINPSHLHVVLTKEHNLGIQRQKIWKWRPLNATGTTLLCQNDRSLRWLFATLHKSGFLILWYLSDLMIRPGNCQITKCFYIPVFFIRCFSGMASRRCTVASHLLNDHLQHAGLIKAMSICISYFK